MNRSANPTAGFTLLELLMVMGIIALVLAAVLVARPNTAGTRLAVAARAVAATLQLARAQAISSNVETIVRVDTRKREFGLARSMHALPRGMSVTLTIAQTERLGDIAGLRFYPDGQSSGGEIVLALEGRASRIVVNWLTGEAQLSP
jgi:general secretion pathway protein H